mgnify:CR=1 FL=1
MAHTNSEILQLFEATLSQMQTPEEPELLYTPIIYSMSGGGKRLRPVLLLITAEAFGGDVEGAMPAALAVEIFHNFTLLHDDIMDNAEVRRGRPSVYAKWGGNVAILSGDAMMIDSFSRLSALPQDKLPRIMDIFTRMALQVCEGQQYDMDFENIDFVPMSDYLKMIGLKTAVLIACAAKLGAIIAEAPAQECDLLYKYGYDLGLAFQVADDWLDTYADPKVFGKAIGGDILNNKKNWLTTRAFEKASGQVREQLLAAMEMPIETEEQKAAKIAAVKDIYAALEVGEEAKQEIVRLHAQAMDHITQLGLEPEKAALLENYAKKLIGRTK